MSERCTLCGGDANYPMLVSWEVGKPRLLCAERFHSQWYDLVYHPTAWKMMKYLWWKVTR